MTLETRLERLEQAQEDRSGPITIRVLRIPSDVPEDLRAEYIRTHPECLDRTITVSDGRVVP